MVPKPILRLRYANTSHLHIPGGGLDAADLLFGFLSTRISIFSLFFLWGHLKSFLYETPVATQEDLTTWIIVASADVASLADLFEHVRKTFRRRCRLSYDLRGHNFK
ncbi:hypothetical protein TNCV_4249021 [Trichonephila clavipes]|nr:hypothetical protein TNCV_4249021 [Trichonephila clavipes]